MNHQPIEMFAIGSAKWPGLSKLAEEAGEVIQVIALSPDLKASNYRLRLIEELGDVLAACDFVSEANALPIRKMNFTCSVVELPYYLGRVVQVIGKLMGTGGRIDHWDGTDLRYRLADEIGNVLTAGQCIRREQRFELAVDERRAEKIKLFWKWHSEVVQETEAYDRAAKLLEQKSGR